MGAIFGLESNTVENDIEFVLRLIIKLQSIKLLDMDIRI